MADLRKRQTRSKGDSFLGDEEDLRFKIVLLGDSGVGKSSLMNRYINESAERPKTTIGMDIFSDLCDIDGNLVKVFFWDTAGQERYHTTLRESYFRAIDAIVVVYDITNMESFKNVETWIKEARHYSSTDNFICMVLGNKCDLPDHRKVSKREAEKLRQHYPEIYWLFETSALEYTNTEKAFKTLVSELAKKHEGVENVKRRKRPDVVRLMDDSDIRRRYMIRNNSLRYRSKMRPIGCGCS